MSESGVEAAAQAARDAAAAVRTYVPGYPVTALGEALQAQIAVSEKVALEIALGASATGLRSVVLVKQMGMNVLLDPLVISATHGIGSGLVVIAGDDLGPKGSQTEMDSRYFGPLAKLPVLDPKDPAYLHASLMEAFSLSEHLRAPVIVRVTAQLLAAHGPPIQPRPEKAPGQRLEREIWELTAKGRQQRHSEMTMASARQAAESSVTNRLEISGDIGIIASGRAAALAEGLGVSLLTIGYAYPLPERLVRRFIDGHRLVLVAEEPEPFIESHLAMSPRVRGKLSGHLPHGLLNRSDIISALEGLEERPARRPLVYESVAERGYEGICEGCPFAPLFSALAAVDVPVAGDAGCAIRASREPFASVDMAYGLGSAAAVASGFAQKGIALLGDFALAHSGLQGLINAVWQKRDLLAVVIKNDVAAMTGGQPSPDLTAALQALLPVRRLHLPAPVVEVEALIREELAMPGPRAVVAEGMCAKKWKM
ncbi:MAG TPA: thiamine pyrophosphate-dependent enzyme [Methanothrix sp.]|nr:indolepyruvate ferredoxin oxidoreductase subunit alpha [Methanothrix sp.]HOV82225.1 thiamine pyrophosphate-dependent enzyme [Methanothrix sp.]HPC89427.1 thiamine pyrophosphate-dependent enzyme [Methanothrix sp.]HQE88386.1 thiamine pyrophosphate-dependent enzyme [Methanothrix sp.]HQI68410.1 thiamine pyrophosphate-dependent enzyme [Methanothrix sp.]